MEREKWIWNESKRHDSLMRRWNEEKSFFLCTFDKISREGWCNWFVAFFERMKSKMIRTNNRCRQLNASNRSYRISFLDKKLVMSCASIRTRMRLSSMFFCRACIVCGDNTLWKHMTSDYLFGCTFAYFSLIETNTCVRVFSYNERYHSGRGEVRKIWRLSSIYPTRYLLFVVLYSILRSTN